MEQHSQANDYEQRAILEDQIRESYGKVVYSHKTHEKCVDILLHRLSLIKGWQIALSAIITGGLFAGIVSDGKWKSVVSLIFSTILLALNTFTKNYDLGELAQKHKQAANDLWLIREKLLSLLTDLKMGDRAIHDLRKERNKLVEELHSVYSGIPSTNYKAYRKAQIALQHNEELTFRDDEIDAFLPEKLKKLHKTGKGETTR